MVGGGGRLPVRGPLPRTSSASRVDDVTYDEALALVERWIAEGGPHVITTPNPEIVMLARRDPAFRATAPASRAQRA